MVLAYSQKEEPPAERSGKPHKWGRRIWRGAESEDVDFTSFCECLQFSGNMRSCITVVSDQVWRHAFHLDYKKNKICLCIFISALFSVEVFQLLILLALSKILKTAWKHSSFCRRKTPSYHTVTPTISKECNGCVPKGERSIVCPARNRLTAHYEGFPKAAMWSEMHVKGGGMEKSGTGLLILKGKKKKKLDGPKGFP